MRPGETVIYVSAYTRHTPYEGLAHSLARQLESFALPHHVYPLANRGSWEKNCQQKADVLAEALRAYQRPVVWIDADATLHRLPTFFDGLDCDLAFHYLSSCYHPRELLTGTLYVGNTERGRATVEAWRELNASNGEWDQRNLQRIVDANSQLRIVPLPTEYIRVDGFEAYQATEPPAVITHHQASRRFKEAINCGSAIS